MKMKFRMENITLFRLSNQFYARLSERWQSRFTLELRISHFTPFSRYRECDIDRKLYEIDFPRSENYSRKLYVPHRQQLTRIAQLIIHIRSSFAILSCFWSCRIKFPRRQQTIDSN